jgi:hypothetical protein
MDPTNPRILYTSTCIVERDAAVSSLPDLPAEDLS